jgi:hypothetical protein
MRRIVAGDLGLANTALVLFEGKRIVDALTITTPASGSRPTFERAIERCEIIAVRVSAFVALHEPEAIVLESYKDFGGGHLRVRKDKPIPNRWTTPLMIGYLARALAGQVPIVWQDPEIVMTRYHQAKKLWALGQRGIAGGDELLQKRGTRNDHCRSAAAHGLFYLETHKPVRP